MSVVQLVTLGSAALFVLVHLFGGKLVFLTGTPRSVWLSGAGGVSIAYVFVHLLPELAQHQDTLQTGTKSAGGILASIESHAYLIALIGLGIYYGVERLGRFAAGELHRNNRERTPIMVFWAHLVAFALFNVLIGYLLVHREETDLRGLIIYAVAMGFHFVVNDQGLRDQHGEVYHEYGRWLLAAAPVAGYLLGISTEISPLLLSSLFAFLAGGVILNVLKEELPENRQSRFWAFATGTTLYSGLLLLTS